MAENPYGCIEPIWFGKGARCVDMRINPKIGRLILAFVLLGLLPNPSLANSPGIFANKTIQTHFITSGSVCMLGRCQETPPSEGRHNVYISASGALFDYALAKTGVKYSIGDWREQSNGDRDRWDAIGTSLRYTLIQHQGSDELQSVLTITAQGKACLVTFETKFKEKMFEPTTTSNDRLQLIYCRVVDGHVER